MDRETESTMALVVFLIFVLLIILITGFILVAVR